MRKRILVADDNALIRRHIRRILEPDQRIEICAEAENGAEAVRKTRKYRPDLVLMDVFMPEMNGFAAVREIKKVSPHLPIVVVTLDDSGGVRGESEKAGADALVLKGDGSLKLLPTIHTLLDRYWEPVAA